MSLHQGFPKIKEPKAHIPANPRDMEKVKEGMLVLITYDNNSHWAVLNSKRNNMDTFVYQKKSGESDTDIICRVKENRNYHSYHRFFGVVLNERKYISDLIILKGKLRENEYEVKRLKIAGIWESQLEGVKA